MCVKHGQTVTQKRCCLLFWEGNREPTLPSLHPFLLSSFSSSPPLSLYPEWETQAPGGKRYFGTSLSWRFSKPLSHPLSLLLLLGHLTQWHLALSSLGSGWDGRRTGPREGSGFTSCFPSECRDRDHGCGRGSRFPDACKSSWGSSPSASGDFRSSFGDVG